MDSTNKHWIMWIKDEAANAEYVELVYCKTEQEALTMGSKIFGIEKELLDTMNKEPYLRKKRSKNAILNQPVINSYWLVYTPNIELWDSELIFCDTGENAIKSALYIHGVTRKCGAVSKKLMLHSNDIFESM